MRTQATFPIPHTNGLRPRSFLAARRVMMRLNIVINGAKAKDYQRIHDLNDSEEND